MKFSDDLLLWYEQNKRVLPWRMTQDPYKIWISEIILQQTRVNQGFDYYNRFISTFPTLSALAQAQEEAVLKLWQGLGYYSRARNIHFAAKQIVSDFQGEFPSSYKDLTSLKGIGDYTASAILSFAFNQPYPVLDGNVARVITRLYGIVEPIDKSFAIKKIKDILENLIDKERAGDFNQAIMEFGALYCKYQNPNCEFCIFNGRCQAYQRGIVADLPCKSPKKELKQRALFYLVLTHKNQVLLNRRGEKDIWQNLYDFPLWDSSLGSILEEDKYEFQYHCRHLLSHQQLDIYFYTKELSKSEFLKKSCDYEIVKICDLGLYPVPKQIETYFKKIFNKN